MREVKCENAEDMRKFYDDCMENRSTTSTKLNDRSVRWWLCAGGWHQSGCGHWGTGHHEQRATAWDHDWEHHQEMMSLKGCCPCRSSRSHAIFTITVHRTMVEVLNEVGDDMKARVRTSEFTSKLHLVDLAGKSPWCFQKEHAVAWSLRNIPCTLVRPCRAPTSPPSLALGIPWQAASA